MQKFERKTKMYKDALMGLTMDSMVFKLDQSSITKSNDYASSIFTLSDIPRKPM